MVRKATEGKAGVEEGEMAQRHQGSQLKTEWITKNLELVVNIKFKSVLLTKVQSVLLRLLCSMRYSKYCIKSWQLKSSAAWDMLESFAEVQPACCFGCLCHQRRLE